MIIWTIIHIVEILLWILLAASGAYILFFALVSMMGKKQDSRLTAYLSNLTSLREPRYNNFLILYPAYNEDRVIVHSVHTFVGQYYPYQNFHVCVISDHMKPETNELLEGLPVTVLQPVFEKSSKAKAMQYAIQMVESGQCKPEGRKAYDYIVILDADNVVEADFLEKLNTICNRGYKAIQCHRCAKNSDNNIAVLDGVSEEINNTIFRKAHNRIGLSSALIGSGMCFDYEWFHENVFKLSTAGEDRGDSCLRRESQQQGQLPETASALDDSTDSESPQPASLHSQGHCDAQHRLHRQDHPAGPHSPFHAHRHHLRHGVPHHPTLSCLVPQVVAVVPFHLPVALRLHPQAVAQALRLRQAVLPADAGMEDVGQHPEDRPQKYRLHPHGTWQIVKLYYNHNYYKYDYYSMIIIV